MSYQVKCNSLLSSGCRGAVIRIINYSENYIAFDIFENENV